jgi:hypothetical protein
LQRLVQFGFLRSDEGFSILLKLECRIVRRALGTEILGDIAIGIAIFPRPFDPDFFAPNALAQELQHRNLIIDAVDPRIASGIRLDHDVAPHRLDHALDRHIVAAGKRDGRPLAISILFEQGQGSNERAVDLIIRAEGQDPEQGGTMRR